MTNKSTKTDWADDIRADLQAMFPHRTSDLKLTSLEQMERSDLMVLAEIVDRLRRDNK